MAPTDREEHPLKQRGRKPKQPPPKDTTDTTDTTPDTTDTTDTTKDTTDTTQSPSTPLPTYKGRIKIVPTDGKRKETADNEEMHAPIDTHNFLEDDEKEKIIALVKEGYTPSIKQTPHNKLITMRTRDVTTSFGEFSPERWNEITTIYEEYKPDDSMLPKSSAKGDYRLKPEASAPTIMLSKSDLRLSDITLQYWFWAKGKGYDGNISDFLNECVENYFASRGIEPVILIKGKDGGLSLD